MKNLNGYFLVTLSFVFWGLTPIYWDIFSNIPIDAVFANRILFTFITAVIFSFFIEKRENIKKAMRSKKILLSFLLSGLLIGANWFIFLYSIIEKKVLETSLGYYLCPIFTLFFGIIFF